MEPPIYMCVDDYLYHAQSGLRGEHGSKPAECN